MLLLAPFAALARVAVSLARTVERAKLAAPRRSLPPPVPLSERSSRLEKTGMGRKGEEERRRERGKGGKGEEERKERKESGALRDDTGSTPLD